MLHVLLAESEPITNMASKIIDRGLDADSVIILAFLVFVVVVGGVVFVFWRWGGFKDFLTAQMAARVTIAEANRDASRANLDAVRCSLRIVRIAAKVVANKVGEMPAERG